MRVRELKHDLLQALNTYTPDTAQQEVMILLKHVLNMTAAEVLMQANTELDHQGCEQLTGMINRRLMGEPLDYIVGSSQFLDRVFHVRPGVLIPRPETEGIIEIIKNQDERPERAAGQDFI